MFRVSTGRVIRRTIAIRVIIVASPRVAKVSVYLIDMNSFRVLHGHIAETQGETLKVIFGFHIIYTSFRNPDITNTLQIPLHRRFHPRASYCAFRSRPLTCRCIARAALTASKTILCAYAGGRALPHSHDRNV
jgi:hypothetical protein